MHKRALSIQDHICVLIHSIQASILSSSVTAFAFQVSVGLREEIYKIPTFSIETGSPISWEIFI